MRTFLLIVFIVIQPFSNKEKALFDAINQYDFNTLHLLLDQNQIHDPYLALLTKAYRNYVQKGAVYDEIAIDKVKETPSRILMYAKYQMVLGKYLKELVLVFGVNTYFGECYWSKKKIRLDKKKA